MKQAPLIVTARLRQIGPPCLNVHAACEDVTMIDRFDDFELDHSLFELRAGGRVVAIEPRVFELISYLVRERRRVVSPEEIFEQVWDGRVVSDSSLTVAVAAARRALGDSARQPRLIRTVSKRGYQFVGSIRTETNEGRECGARVADTEEFFGREKEIATLRELIAAAAAGRFGVALISGEAGIGKTSLLEQVKAVGEREGMLVLTGRCFEVEGAAAYWPWVQVIQQCIQRLSRRAIKQRLGAIADALFALLPDVGENKSDAEALGSSRLRVFEAIALMVREVAARKPAVILLDDLHRADEPSLLLLEFLVAELRSVPAAIIASHRDAESGRSAFRSRSIANVCRQGRATRIDLAGFGAIDVERLVELCVGSKPSPEVVARISDLTGGNPFFVKQIAREASREFVESPSLTVPPTISQAVLQQIDGLSESTQEFLSMAAVVGRDFARPVLEHAGVSTDEFFRCVGEATKARVLARGTRRPDAYRFAHVLVRDALYDRIDPKRRGAIHRKVGEALEHVHGGEIEIHLAEIAHHFRAAAGAGQEKKALEYSERAARWAMARFAYEEATEHLLAAMAELEIVDPSNDERRCDILGVLGASLLRAGDREAGRDAFARCSRLAKEIQDPVRLANAALGISPGLLAVEAGAPDAMVISLLRDALESLSEEHVSSHVKLLARLSMALFWAGADAERRQLSERAWHLAERLDDRELQGIVLLARWFAEWDPVALEARWEIAAEIERRRSELRDPELLMLSELFSATCLLEQGEIGRFDDRTAAFGRSAEDLRQPEGLWYAMLLRAMRALLAGNFELGERLSCRFEEIGMRVGDANVFHSRMAHRLVLAWEQGRPHEVVEVAAEAAERHPGILGWRAARAWALGEAGRLVEAAREFESLASEGFQRIPRTMDWSVAVALLSDLCGRLGDARRARQLYELLLPMRNRYIVLGLCVMSWGSASRYLGILAGTFLDTDEVQSHFEEAIAQNTAIGAAAWAAHSKRDYAHWVCKRELRDLWPRASELLGEAELTAQDLGMQNLLARIRVIRADEGNLARRGAGEDLDAVRRTAGD